MSALDAQFGAGRPAIARADTLHAGVSGRATAPAVDEAPAPVIDQTAVVGLADGLCAAGAVVAHLACGARAYEAVPAAIVGLAARDPVAGADGGALAAVGEVVTLVAGAAVPAVDVPAAPVGELAAAV